MWVIYVYIFREKEIEKNDICILLKSRTLRMVGCGPGSMYWMNFDFNRQAEFFGIWSHTAESD